MKIRHFFILHLALSVTVQASQPETAEYWYEAGKNAVTRNTDIALAAQGNVQQQARNIILFVGDGMGISTVTAARILDGQMRGMTGEENELFFETFPHLALSKTYNTNQQTPDSAGTMTAMMSGIKTKAGLIGVNQKTVRGDCDSQKGNETVTALELAEIAGMSTGVISTARITHATPAATYAHIMDRDFEDDHDATKLSNPGNCVDIARQLVEFPQRFKNSFPWVDGIEVALGGGRRSFITGAKGADPEDGGKGERLDNRDLTREWLQNYRNAAYVWNQIQFDAINPAKTDHLLGLFEMSHMEYELDRATDTGGEPSLSEMTEKAIHVLKKNRRGFFLHVEGGRIDHAHHATNPKRALLDTIELAKAVKVAYELTDPTETLIIVTADHSHVFNIAGYPTRGNPILGKVVGNDNVGNPEKSEARAADGMPYTTLNYVNGRGFRELPDHNTADAIYQLPINMQGRSDLSEVDTSGEGFHSESIVPLAAETHGGEDVAIYATGPGSAVINGVMEQNEIFHVMMKAGNLSGKTTQRSP
ncbi:MAG: alkaline phosphatase [Porticoccaceae bacterium]